MNTVADIPADVASHVPAMLPRVHLGGVNNLEVDPNIEHD